MFASATSAKLQEIGPRFTLKLRWLRKGLPSVTSADGQVPRGGDAEDVEVDHDQEQEKMDEDEAMAEMGAGKAVRAEEGGIVVPALDEDQEYEWKWKVSRCCMVDTYGVKLRMCSPRWRFRGGLSSCNDTIVVVAPRCSIAAEL